MVNKNLIHTNIPPVSPVQEYNKGMINTKFLFGQKVIITSGFYKGTKGFIVDFESSSEDKVIGVPPYTQVMKTMNIIYKVRIEPFKSMYMDSFQPENNLRKALL
jgi:hypothetical protein